MTSQPAHQPPAPEAIEPVEGIGLSPCRAKAERFLAALDPGAAGFTFQTFDDDRVHKDKTLAKILHGTLDQHWPNLVLLSGRGAGVHVTVNETDFVGRTSANIVRVRALFIDLDGAPLDPVVAGSTPPPHIVIESSPGRWHAYWLVSDLPLDRFTPLQKAIAARFDGDPSVHDLPRVMRLPGFLHQKGEPFLSLLQDIDERFPPYTLQQMIEAFPPAEPESTGEKHSRSNGAGHKFSRYGDLNERALASLSSWVPIAFPTAKKTNIGYRVASTDLGRGREEDLSLTTKGIKYFGDHDMGDARAGRRTAIDVVMEYMHLDLPGAATWLEHALDGNGESGEGAQTDHAAVLEGLVTKAEADPGAPFAPEALAALAALKKTDRAAFETLRSQLKGAHARVTALDEVMADESGDGGRGPSQSDILLDLAQAAELFHTSDGTGFADLDINGHRETWAIRAKGFRRWLARRFYEEIKGAPNSEAMASAIGVIEAKAHFDGPERKVHIRVGGVDGRLYLDLCDAAWQAVEIDASGWRVIDAPPVRFRRATGMLPLPLPAPGGEIEDLRPFLNVRKPDNGTDTNFVLAVAWIMAALRDCGPYPVLALAGEHGSAKSTFAKIMRSLLDPSASPLRALPREDRDLFIAASNAHVLSFDNLSGLPAWISDTLCRLSTGGGFATRTLYTDQDETLFDGVRPVILNGIEEVITRPDLADRTIFLTLEAIPEQSRRPAKTLLAEFEVKRPRILGALLDAAVDGLWRLPETRLDKLPRMADFAIWITACEGALWERGAFAIAYRGNRDDAVESVIEADPVATALRTFMAGRKEWSGKAADLLGALAEVAGDKVTKAKTWPDSPRALSGRLRRAAPFLRKVGVTIDFDREKRATRTRIITVTANPTTPGPEPEGDFASIPSIPSKPNNSSGLQRTVEWTVGAGDTHTVHSTVHSNPLKDKAPDGVDGMDAKIPADSGPGKTGVSGLTEWHLRQLAAEYLRQSEEQHKNTGNVDSTALDRDLRRTLAAEGVLPGSIETEFERVMQIVFAV